MRDWKVILVAGAALVLAGCNSLSPTAPLEVKSAQAHYADCESRTGYFVRSGRSEHYSDSDCLVEIPN